jgi:hypothetical protein
VNELNYNKQLLICGVIFTLHNIEETVGYARFTFPGNINLPFTPPTVQPMIWSIAVITVVAWLIFLFAVWKKSDKLKRDVFAVTITVFLINALFPHILSAIVIQRYSPAFVTSALLYLPYAIVMLPRLYRNYQPRSAYFKLAIIWVLLLALMTVVLQMIMKFIFQQP